jgi:trimeric autotransporter adhesin
MLSYANQAKTMQTGNLHEAYVNQVAGVLGASDKNQATITQAGTTGKHTATVNQNNLSENNTATVMQTGTTNIAQVEQIDNATKNKATVTQSGISGNAYINQGLAQDRSIADIKQGGTSNISVIVQSKGGDGDANGVGNEAYTEQFTGVNNYAFIQQGDVYGYSGSSAAAHDNYAKIKQDGSFNQARLWQTGDKNTGNVTQTGFQNQLAGLTGSPYGFDQFAKQWGNGNTLTVSQVSAPGGPGQIAHVEMVGNNNTSTITQSN